MCNDVQILLKMLKNAAAHLKCSECFSVRALIMRLKNAGTIIKAYEVISISQDFHWQILIASYV